MEQTQLDQWMEMQREMIQASQPALVGHSIFLLLLAIIGIGLNITVLYFIYKWANDLLSTTRRIATAQERIARAIDGKTPSPQGTSQAWLDTFKK